MIIGSNNVFEVDCFTEALNIGERKGGKEEEWMNVPFDRFFDIDWDVISRVQHDS